MFGNRLKPADLSDLTKLLNISYKIILEYKYNYYTVGTDSYVKILNDFSKVS